MRKQFTFLLAVTLFSSLPAPAQLQYTLITAGLEDVYESGSTEFEIGDIDGDGDLDIVSVGDHYSPLIPEEHGIMVFQNNGDGTSWTKIMEGDFGYGGVALGDANNDGFMDIAFGIHHNYAGSDFGNQFLEVVLGNGTNSGWIPWDDGLGVNGQNWGMFGCDFADVDNDGWLDLGANSFGSPDGVWIYKNNGNGTWSVFAGATVGNSSMNFKFADFNNDGKVDFISNNTQFNGQPYQVWQNNGSGIFIPMQDGLVFMPDPNAHLFSFYVADVNNDGTADIAINQSGYPRVHTWDIPTSTWLNISTGLPVANVNSQRIALGDMNNDGNTDLVMYVTGYIRIYHGDGAGNWTNAGSFSHTETTCYDMKLADLDHNGFLDIAYWAKHNGTNMLRVFLYDSTAYELSIKPVFPAGSEFFCHGSVQFIRWISTVPLPDTATVTIDFSSSGPTGPYTNIVTNAPNSDWYQWTVPGITSYDCYLKFTISNGVSSYTTLLNSGFGIDTCGSTPVIPGPVTGFSTVCEGSQPSYSVPPAIGATSYTWTLPAGWTGNSLTNTINTTAGPNSGFVSVVANSAGGTSAQQSLFVNVIVVDTSVIPTGITLTAAVDSAIYQWINCDTGLPVQGAVNQSFTPSANGSYAVIISKDGCLDTSLCHTVIVIGLNEPGKGSSLQITPNPAKGRFVVTAARSMEEIEIISLSGESILKVKPETARFEINLSSHAPGYYFVFARTGTSHFRERIILLP